MPRRSSRSRRILACGAPTLLGLSVAFTLSVAAEPDGSPHAPPEAATLVTVQQPAAAEPAVEVVFADRAEESQPGGEPPPHRAPEPAPDPCGDALAWVADAGLSLPDGVGYACPSNRFAHHGAACWNATPCRASAFIAINLELMGEVSLEYVRHVVAHEVCHIRDFQAQGWTTEAAADACAAAHGAP